MTTHAFLESLKLTPRRLGRPEPDCMPGPYSELGLRVEAACQELDRVTDRLIILNRRARMEVVR